MFDFAGEVAIITGAAGNLGQALAHAFGAAGAHLVLVDHKPGRLESLYPALAGTDGHWLAAPVELTDSGAVQALAEGVLSRFGAIDILVNAAGGYAGGKSLAETGLDEWDSIFARNLRTALLATRAVLPSMVVRRRGRIVNVSSRSAYQPGGNMAAYSAAKQAVLKLTESTAAETKSLGITVNCVVPSTIDSPENRAAMPKADPAKWVSAGSLAQVILFLASPLAADITGVALPVYGRV